MTDSISFGLDMRFEVTIDGFDLGAWTTCKGLKVTFEYSVIKELGEHTTRHFVPTFVNYPHVSLQRAIAKDDWSKTKRWLQAAASAPWILGEDLPGVPGVPGGPSSTTIALLDAHLETVAAWTLENAMPASWSGPTLNANGKMVALETLELIHEGFLECEIS
jgi:phage tail-like protein